MNRVRIALIDDQTSMVEKMAGLIGGATRSAEVRPEFFRVALPDPQFPPRDSYADLTELLKELVELRQSGAGRGRTIRKIESTDLVLVDFDLRKLPSEEGLITGERIAQLLRLFTRTGPIVSVDRRLMRLFELSHRHPPSTNADFMVHVEDLGIQGLWGETPDGYDPWYWPNLVETARNYTDRVRFVEAHYEDRITTSLGVPDEVEAILPGEDARVALDLREASFSELAEALVPPREEIPLAGDSRHRVAASAVGVWLQSVILPPQDILIDAPHLVRHTPSLLRGEPKVSNLKGLVLKEATATLPLDLAKLERHRFEHRFWLDRPAWWTSRVLQDREIKDIAEPWSKEPLPLKFAEDASGFHAAADLAPYDSEGFFATRYVKGPKAFKDVHYEPKRRLAT